MHLLLPRNVSVNRTLVEMLKKYHSNPVETRPAPSACRVSEKEAGRKVIRAALVTGIPGWPGLPSICHHPAQLLPALQGQAGVKEGAGDPSTLVSTAQGHTGH